MTASGCTLNSASPVTAGGTRPSRRRFNSRLISTLTDDDRVNTEQAAAARKLLTRRHHASKSEPRRRQHLTADVLAGLFTKDKVAKFSESVVFCRSLSTHARWPLSVDVISITFYITVILMSFSCCCPCSVWWSAVSLPSVRRSLTTHLFGNWSASDSYDLLALYR